ncbi:hypothetical protein [Curtobacterium sp. MCBD17_028]|uniref:hypothetical protein n=1 Tax=Curtobacterium sp. MCBD17_028 TaxID=2175670 RepID=UPI0011B6B760|nr:hypothetical protein [Curtobacterium sp. MCBD17_028]
MLVDEYAESADAALQAHYAPRDPIAEFIRGDITFRQLRVLAEGLPADSAVTRAHIGSTWTVTDWLLHDVSSQLRSLNAGLANMFREKGEPAIEPKFLPTPLDGQSVEDAVEEQYREQQRAEMDEVAAVLFANNQR